MTDLGILGPQAIQEIRRMIREESRRVRNLPQHRRGRWNKSGGANPGGDNWAQIQPDWFNQTVCHHGFIHANDWPWYTAYPVSEMTLLDTGGLSDSYIKRSPAVYSITPSGFTGTGSGDINRTWQLGMRAWSPLGSSATWLSETDANGNYWKLTMPFSVPLGTARLQLFKAGVADAYYDVTYSSYPNAGDALPFSYVGGSSYTGQDASITASVVDVPATLFASRISSSSNWAYDNNTRHTSFSATIDTSETLRLFFPRWVQYSPVMIEPGQMWNSAAWIPPRAFVRYDADNIITAVMMNQTAIPNANRHSLPVWSPHNIHVTMAGATDTNYNNTFLLMPSMFSDNDTSWPEWVEPEAADGYSRNTTKFRMTVSGQTGAITVNVLSSGSVVATYVVDPTPEYEHDFSEEQTLGKTSGTADWPADITVLGKYNVGGYYAKP